MNEQVSGSERRLIGRPIPDLEFRSTGGGSITLTAASGGSFVLFIYPRTGKPDQPESADWALIPGARGCTAESCAFRDLAADFAHVGLSIYGLSAQDAAEQQEASDRLHLPYPLLSDPSLSLAGALELPTFRFEGQDLYRRSTLVVRNGAIAGAHLEIRDAVTHPHDLLDGLRISAVR